MPRSCPHLHLIAHAVLAATLGCLACDTADGTVQDAADIEVMPDVGAEPDARPDSDPALAHHTDQDGAIDIDQAEVFDTDVAPDNDTTDATDLAQPEDTSAPICTDGDCVVDPEHDLHIDVQTVLVAGTLEVEGELRCATLRFIALDAHDQTHEVRLPCSGASRAFTTRLPAPYAYAVHIFMPMSITIGATPASSMLGTMSLLPRIEIDHDRTDLRLEVAVVSLDGIITQNGAPPVVYPSCVGSEGIAVAFRETDAPAQVTAYLRCAPVLAFDDVVLHRDRTYSVHVSAWPGMTSLPEDQSLARAAYRPAVDDDVFDVRTATVSGTITLDGAPPATAGCHTRAAQLAFLDRQHGTTQYVQIPCDTDWTFAATLPHGQYDVRVGSEGSNLPTWAQVAHALSVPTDGPVALDVATVPVDITLTLDGGPWPNEACADTLATLVLIAEDTRGSASYLRLPCAGAGRAQLTHPPGTFQAHVGGARLPFTDDPVAIDLRATITLPSAEPIVLDLRTAEVSGTITLNGAPLADLCAAHPDGLGIALRPLDAPLRSAWSVLLPCETRGDYALRLPLGAYDVIVASAGGPRLPPQVQVADRIDVTADTSDLDFDVRAVTVSGTITVDGQEPPDEGPCPLHRARATLRGERGDASTWAELVIPCGAPSWRFADVAVPAGAHIVTIDGMRVPHTTLPYRLVFE